jgi:hypothetical protein
MGYGVLGLKHCETHKHLPHKKAISSAKLYGFGIALRCLSKNKFSSPCIQPLAWAKLGSDLSTDLLEALLLHLGILGEVEHTPQQGCR